MLYPNKTYVLDTTELSFMGGRTKRVVVVVAKDAETACQHLKDKLNFDGVPNELIWLMDTNHKTLYEQTGQKPLEVQAKIMYNTSCEII